METSELDKVTFSEFLSYFKRKIKTSLHNLSYFMGRTHNYCLTLSCFILGHSLSISDALSSHGNSLEKG